MSELVAVVGGTISKAVGEELRRAREIEHQLNPEEDKA